MTTITIPTSRAEAEALDADDPLAARRELFDLPDGITYLVGHSLGPAPKAALARLEETARQDWREGLVRSWNSASWIDLAAVVGAKIAPLIGAEAEEVVVCDSVSVNLFKLAAAALPLARARSVSVEDDEFPTDQYVAEGLARTTGGLFRRLPAGSGLAGLSEGGVLIKSAVNYRSGQIADIKGFERAAQAAGSVIVWDLSHAAGIIPVALRDHGARFAAGCTYKYVNGGPGAPSFVFVRKDVVERLVSPIPGWLGHAAPFAFDNAYRPAQGVQRFVAGTPGILSLAALDGSLSVFDGVSMEAVAAKAHALGDLCLVRGKAMGLRPTSPPASERGGHVSLRHGDGYAVVQALAAEGVLADFRTPDTIRLGLSPLFLRYTDVWDAMDTLGAILRDARWDDPKFRVRAKVT